MIVCCICHGRWRFAGHDGECNPQTVYALMVHSLVGCADLASHGSMLLSILMAGTSEALQLGIDNGLDPKVLSDIMLKGSGRNWALYLYNPCPDVLPNVPSSNDYQGGFMVDLMAKDLGLAAECAQLSQSATPMGSLARNLYVTHQRQGNGKLDFSSIFRFFGKK